MVPILADITVDGRRIKAAVQLTKTAFAFVFDRVTGKPVWPIEERSVPSGDVPGEWYSPTQPFPTKPPALDMQGLTTDDLIDFTPELRQEAIKIVSRYPNGNGPRDHPTLKPLNLPPLGTLGRPSPLLTKTLLFIGEGMGRGAPRIPVYGGGKMFRAYNKKTGQVVWEMELPGGTTSAPMTYMVNGKQYIVVAVGWEGMPAELIGLALP